ncbi:MAG TPA: hypothetical protein VH083_12500 [Myxococcales bacterium]|jgi:hypothetical protein|nr:hypothetical protein [Myxococcales bacterium]
MTVRVPPSVPKTIADWLAQPEEARLELIDGELDWICERTLTVHRHGEGGYVIALRAEAGERVRAEPFDAVELQVGLLLGDDPE